MAKSRIEQERDLGTTFCMKSNWPNRVTKVSTSKLLIGKEARPFGLVPVAEYDKVVDVDLIRNIAKHKMERNAKYDQLRFDKNKATIVRHKVGAHVLLKNEERHQTKLDPIFKDPFLVTEILPGDRYKLKALKSNRTYKYSHEFLRSMLEKGITTEYDDEVMTMMRCFYEMRKCGCPSCVVRHLLWSRRGLREDR